MKRVKLSRKLITKDDPAFSLEGMIEPVLYNEGETSARVLDMIIKPGIPFVAGFQNFKSAGNIPIEFLNETGKKNKIVCVYGTLIEPNCN